MFTVWARNIACKHHCVCVCVSATISLDKQTNQIPRPKYAQNWWREKQGINGRRCIWTECSVWVPVHECNRVSMYFVQCASWSVDQHLCCWCGMIVASAHIAASKLHPRPLFIHNQSVSYYFVYRSFFVVATVKMYISTASRSNTWPNHLNTYSIGPVSRTIVTFSLLPKNELIDSIIYICENNNE